MTNTRVISSMLQLPNLWCFKYFGKSKNESRESSILVRYRYYLLREVFSTEVRGLIKCRKRIRPTTRSVGMTQ